MFGAIGKEVAKDWSKPEIKADYIAVLATLTLMILLFMISSILY